MATTRPFAYNPTLTPISGTTQVGKIAVGTIGQDYDANPGGIPWWMGPNEDSGYVIIVPNSGNTQPSPIMLSAPTEHLTLSNVYVGNDISLTNSGQTASQLFGYQQTVLGNAQIDPNGKVMFSIRFNTTAPGTSPNSHFVGIGRDNMNYKSEPPYGAYPGNDDQSMGYCSDGNIYYNGGVYWGGLETWTDNDYIDIAIDNNINAMWVRVNSGYWNNNDQADPAAGTFGFEIINGPFYPALCPGYEGTMIVQNTSLFGVPSGYTLLGTNLTASLAAFGTRNFVDSDFISLSEYVSNLFGTPQSFTGISEASTWLTTNGYWNSYGLLSSFTISPSDFTNGGPIYQNTFGVGTNGVDGFVNTAAQGNFLEGYYGQGLTPSAVSAISAAVTQAGLDPNNQTGYIWSVTWGAGSSISTGYVKFGYYAPGSYFDIQTVDPADTDWQLPGYNNGTSLAGTFLFPATFTQYIPTTNKGGWC